MTQSNESDSWPGSTAWTVAARNDQPHVWGECLIGVFDDLASAMSCARAEAANDARDPGDYIEVLGFVLNDPGMMWEEVWKSPKAPLEEL